MKLQKFVIFFFLLVPFFSIATPIESVCKEYIKSTRLKDHFPEDKAPDFLSKINSMHDKLNIWAGSTCTDSQLLYAPIFYKNILSKCQALCDQQFPTRNLLSDNTECRLGCIRYQASTRDFFLNIPIQRELANRAKCEESNEKVESLRNRIHKSVN